MLTWLSVTVCFLLAVPICCTGTTDATGTDNGAGTDDGAGTSNVTGTIATATNFTVVRHYEQTVTIMTLDRRGQLIYCDVIELTGEQKDAIRNLSTIYTVYEVQLQELMESLYWCEQLDTVGFHRAGRTIDVDHTRSNEVNLGILRGTLWCGLGDAADGWGELGQYSVDLCCRTHDFCPLKVRGWQSNYGHMNYFPFTISHCFCDALFHKCLHDANSPRSRAVGRLYFNRLRMNCLATEHDSTHGFRLKSRRQSRFIARVEPGESIWSLLSSYF